MNLDLLPNNAGPVQPRKKRNFDHEDDSAASAPSKPGCSRSLHHDMVGQDFPDETRSVCSISNHMARLGQDVASPGETIPATRGDHEPKDVSLASDPAAPSVDNDVSPNISTNAPSSLDARISTLSEMKAEDRCAQLVQDAQANTSDVAMEAEFLDYNDDSPGQGDTEMPELEEVSDAELEECLRQAKQT